MIALIQRVLHASVVVDGETIGAIGPGLLALVGVRPDDNEKSARRLVERILGYRVFSDDAGRMNRSLADTAGGLLLVPQFTLAADTRTGMRASFTSAAEPGRARDLFELAVTHAQATHASVQTGRFGAEMAVSLTNHGPVTFWLES
ncbi:D-aminoacyl-tRNA deacylase [Niveibacterium sp. 24ML]|uniref:D-aminoacyl-tRNA deacylase n=1 Tax=Niveibacterium sp. 24ML TaxID=2985512 RepID=UPI002271CDFF|nr:D-aminoacyl-tRNA deacylase [Niveibacterium sp. 24ML]MCX9156923.1 D-aminoacyl-tRNA deacylase [Niveibacterium sp. 24ML]